MGSRSATQSAMWSSVFKPTPRCYLSRLPPIHGALELRLRHLRAALDTHVPRLVVELVTGPPLVALRPRAEAAAPPGRDVVARQTRGPLRLAGPRPLLVDRARGDLLRLLLGRSPVLDAVL